MVLFCIGLSIGVTVAVGILLYYQVQVVAIRNFYTHLHLDRTFLQFFFYLLDERNINKQDSNRRMDCRKGFWHVCFPFLIIAKHIII